MLLDPEGGTTGWTGPQVDARLRLRIDGAWGRGRLALESDVFAGPVLGDTWDLAALDERGRDTLDPLALAAFRKANVGVRLPFADLQVGLDTSHWGLGVLANDGASDPLFGRTDFGDRVLRARLATMPLGEERPLYLVLAGDRVVSDEQARWAAGDAAYQAIAALLWDDPGDGGAPRRLGLYGVHRRQTDADGRFLRVTVLDATGAATVPVGALRYTAATEGALILGGTDVSRTLAAPEGVGVRAGGAALHQSLGDAEDRWVGHLRAALASGDRSTDDDRVTDFRFDRDHDVGMVLFDEVLSAIDLDAWRRVTDPDGGAVPPDGVDVLAAEGAFHQAFALQPALQLAPVPWLDLRVGGLFAWSTGPISHPWRTFRAGGAPTNHLGRPADGRYLGSELDWAIGTREAAWPRGTFRPTLQLQVGHAWPSEALSGGVARVDHLLLLARVRR